VNVRRCPVAPIVTWQDARDLAKGVMLKSMFIALGLIGSLAAQALADSHSERLARIEVLDGGLTARGTYLAALSLTLKKGWKTYWRTPGEAGIPPRFDWGNSSNIAEVAISWPTPKVFELYGMNSIGYYDKLVLPIEITPQQAGQPVTLAGRIEIGVCKDVCVPGALDVSHQLDAKAGRNPAIMAALADQPDTAGQAGVRSATCRLSPIEDGLRIEASIDMPKAGTDEFTVIEAGTPDVWASPTDTRREGSNLIAAADLISDTSGAFALDRSQIRITVLGSDRAVDIRGCTAG
jgi:DsbC/DsbD-like thiol-disulfide interchange protein